MTPARTTRRKIVVASVGVAALVAGVGVGVLRSKPQRAGTPAPADEGPRDWGKEPFERPEGGKLALADFSGKPLLLNFWATWCAPCVREMPLLDQFYKDHKAAGWQVFGLAVDKIDPVRQFLAQRPVSYPIGVTSLDALEWMRSLGNMGGGLPFSLAFDSTGAPLQKKLGEVLPADLQAWAESIR